MALLGLRYETDEIYEQEEEVVEGDGAEAGMPQISGFHRRLPACVARISSCV